MKCIVSIINEEYSYPFQVMLTSLVTNNPNLSCDYIVMYGGKISDLTIKNIKNIYSNVKFVQIKNEFISYDKLLNYRTEQWLNRDYSVFSRFEIFNLNEYNKLIYIDVDTIIVNDINYLLNECNDDECYAVKRENGRGFNAGVMVINKKESFDIYKNKCLHIINKIDSVNGNQIIFNKCFENLINYIDCRYNLTTLYSETHTHLKNNTAVILHYPGNYKPWDKNKFSPCYESASDWIKSEFINKWHYYEDIFKNKYKIL